MRPSYKEPIINLFKKYFFGLAVFSYLITVVGIPVYFHYCGGELEKISYLIKTKGCCDDEGSEESSNDCCKDEGFVLKNCTDFSINSFSYKLSKPAFNLIFHSLPNCYSFLAKTFFHQTIIEDFPPPKILNNFIVSITVLRI